MSRASPAIAVAAADRLGESPLWRAEEQAVYWIDFFGPTIHRWQPATGARRDWRLEGAATLGSIVAAADGRFLAATEAGILLFDPADGSARPYADPNEGRIGIGLNDAKADRRGRYWVGSYDVAEAEPRGILYRRGADGRFAVADSGYVVCNGPAFSPDGNVLYFSDTAGRRLLAYPCDPETGRLGPRRLFAQIAAEDGFPDGLAVDAEGGLWCAHYGGGRLARFAPDGRIERTVRLPVPNVTSCCFGGPALTTLYVTTGREGLDAAALAAAPQAGALFAVEAGVAGLAELPVRLAP